MYAYKGALGPCRVIDRGFFYFWSMVMNNSQEGTRKLRLTNLTINSLGLVKRGANGRQFHFVKSVVGKPEQQGEDMTDEKQDVQVETLSTEEVEAFRAWMAAQAEEPAADETEAPKEAAGETVEFADKLLRQEKELTEDFTAKLAVEQAKTEKLTERLDASEHQRRLRQFTDVAATYTLPVAGVEQFGEDLMTIKDSVGDEVYGRLTAMLRASDEAINQGALFEQFAQPVRAEHGDPFLAKTVAIQNKLLENDPRKDTNEAYSEAMVLAEQRHPDLARTYAIQSTGGA